MARFERTYPTDPKLAVAVCQLDATQYAAVTDGLAGHDAVDAIWALLDRACAAAVAPSPDHCRPVLVTFPELATTGYGIPTDALRQRALTVQQAFERTHALAVKHQINISLGYAEVDETAETPPAPLYNGSLLVSRDPSATTPLIAYRKDHLYGDWEAGHFATPAPSDPIRHAARSVALPTDAGVWRVATLVCWDIEHPEPARALVLASFPAGVHLLLVPTANTEGFVPEHLVPTRAWENHVAIAYTNWIGGPLGMCGQSVVVRRDGGVVLTMPSLASHQTAAPDSDAASVWQISHTVLQDDASTHGAFMARNPQFEGRRSHLYTSLTEASSPTS
ncbi:hypothetical protein CXG81DRAFT_24617 [Caulochytrium protostelioides]|uniref:CN hydrolase domain-containing protein n=1 Tax=Caulochytrium protostelioides TaxID=1555241 RepID=A0A4P9XBE6_9FUNG|nr:hypothetical protein CXG81DRAFT_24617 [Caulochytrium protostelioides]|eukprot:RKP02737.1 hypothetical protein CXG81DRAFT_24617 [Caulochytrium protostelioides]